LTATPFVAVLAGLRRRLDYTCTPAPAYLKAYADSMPWLAGKVRIELLQGTVLDEPAAAAAAIAALAPALAGFSCYVWNIEAVLEVCGRLRALRPGVKIILGGPEAAPQAERLLGGRDAVDYVCLGEGEATFAELLGRLSSGAGAEGIPGLAWRGPAGPGFGPARSLLENLDSVPSPLLAGLIPAGPGIGFVLETSRGCPRKCSFCDWQTGQKTRYYAPDRILREAAWLLERVPRFEVFIADADIFSDLPRAKTIIEGLGRLSRGRWCSFCFQTWIPRLDDEVMRLLNQPQFKVAAGVESLNPEALRSLDRPLVGEEVLSAVGRLRAHAPRCRLELQLVYGLPGDNPAGFRNSLAWALAQAPDEYFMPRALALPGAELGRAPGRFGIEAETAAPHRVLSSRGFTPEDIDAAENLVYRIGALAFDDIFPWTAGRLAGLSGKPDLEIWEGLLAALDAAGLSASFESVFRSADRYSRSFYETRQAWRESRNFRDWARVARALDAFVHSFPSAAGQASRRSTFLREFRRRKFWFLCEKAVLSAPLRRLSLKSDGLMGRHLQRLKFFAYYRLRRALAGGEGGTR
jgi:hypothetical protein